MKVKKEHYTIYFNVLKGIPVPFRANNGLLDQLDKKIRNNLATSSNITFKNK